MCAVSRGLDDVCGQQCRISTLSSPRTAYLGWERRPSCRGPKGRYACVARTCRRGPVGPRAAHLIVRLARCGPKAEGWPRFALLCAALRFAVVRVPGPINISATGPMWIRSCCTRTWCLCCLAPRRSLHHGGGKWARRRDSRPEATTHWRASARQTIVCRIPGGWAGPVAGPMAGPRGQGDCRQAFSPRGSKRRRACADCCGGKAPHRQADRQPPCDEPRPAGTPSVAAGWLPTAAPMAQGWLRRGGVCVCAEVILPPL